jgi:hypothetical protein
MADDRAPPRRRRHDTSRRWTAALTTDEAAWLRQTETVVSVAELLAVAGDLLEVCAGWAVACAAGRDMPAPTAITPAQLARYRAAAPAGRARGTCGNRNWADVAWSLDVVRAALRRGLRAWAPESEDERAQIEKGLGWCTRAFALVAPYIGCVTPAPLASDAHEFWHSWYREHRREAAPSLYTDIRARITRVALIVLPAAVPADAAAVARAERWLGAAWYEFPRPAPRPAHVYHWLAHLARSQFVVPPNPYGRAAHSPGLLVPLFGDAGLSADLRAVLYATIAVRDAAASGAADGAELAAASSELHDAAVALHEGDVFDADTTPAPPPCAAAAVYAANALVPAWRAARPSRNTRSVAIAALTQAARVAHELAVAAGVPEDEIR